MPQNKANRPPTITKPRISHAGALGHLETAEAMETFSVRALVESEEAKAFAIRIDAWKIASR